MGLFERTLLILALVIIGPGKLPDIGKGLGEAIRGFKKALSEGTSDSNRPSDIPKKK